MSQSIMLFMEIPTFKAKVNTTSIDIVKNPHTGKLFAYCNGKNFKVQQDITSDKPIKFMYASDALFDEGCITNVTPANPPVMSL